MEKENLIKQVCKKYNLTHKELGDEIGYSESTIRTLASSGKISLAVEKAIKLYCECLELRSDIHKLKGLKEVLDKF